MTKEQFDEKSPAQIQRRYRVTYANALTIKEALADQRKGLVEKIEKLKEKKPLLSDCCGARMTFGDTTQTYRCLECDRKCNSSLYVFHDSILDEAISIINQDQE